MYRAVALFVIESKVDPSDAEAVASVVKGANISIKYVDGEQKVILNGRDVSGMIRTPEVSAAASQVSAVPAVRAHLLQLQLDLAAEADVIMDGRDIGTCVLPNADVKIYLTASSEVRAHRRALELREKGMEVDEAQIQKEIEERDQRDMTREISPLKEAEDAVRVDSSYMTIEEVADRILAIVEEKTGVKKNGAVTKSDAPKRTVIVAKKSGFCFGVKRAVDQAYEAAKNADRPIYTFGPIIHNEEVVNDLKSRGVNVINTLEELEAIEDGVIIIRSHGVSKAIYDRIMEKGLGMVDTTCPFVKKIHQTVASESEKGMQMVIVGNAKHPEVDGILGWCTTKAIVIESLDDVDEKMASVPEDMPICVVSQTTFNYKKFKDIVAKLEKKRYHINVVNTICNATHERQAEASEIAAKVDGMIVIGGKNSSNTQKLFEICRKECENTCYIQTLADLDDDWLRSVATVGITAGASTPNYIIEEVQKHVGEF
ncbi:MAG: 4-hydroxy-3-methylbut-2-enyl diphosphate reductase [Lachnospiraceae bacterium]|nr:4-hydroxy-3-methylbut-2-enyl diphosphate reductase [Lachnospiraceae bacterium]